MSFFLEKNRGRKLSLISAMELAAEQSKNGLEQTTPNPCVGCIIVDGKDNLIGVGYHRKYGSDHAELEALKSITNFEKVAGATVYVTLEPCAHSGATPPCALILSRSSIEKVVYLLTDPNPRVSGKGRILLEEAQKKVYCVEEILEHRKKFKSSKDPIVLTILKNKKKLKSLIHHQRLLNRQFFYSMNSDLPYITIKWAQTLNGVIGQTNKRLLISNEDSIQNVHHQRACHDIIMVGYKTVQSDNPMLNNRYGSSRNKKNKILIVDPNREIFDFKEKYKIFDCHDFKNIYFFTKSEGKKAPSGNSHVIHVPVQKNEEGEYLDLAQGLRHLKSMININSVFVEGGGRIIKYLLDQQLYNELVVYINPIFNFSKTAIKIHRYGSLVKLISPMIKSKLSFKSFEDHIAVQMIRM